MHFETMLDVAGLVVLDRWSRQQPRRAHHRTKERVAGLVVLDRWSRHDRVECRKAEIKMSLALLYWIDGLDSGNKSGGLLAVFVAGLVVLDRWSRLDTWQGTPDVKKVCRWPCCIG